MKVVWVGGHTTNDEFLVVEEGHGEGSRRQRARDAVLASGVEAGKRRLLEQNDDKQ